MPVAGRSLSLGAVRLEPCRAPDAMDRVLAQAEVARQFTARPVRGAILGRALGGRQHPRLELGRDDGGPAPRVAILHQPVVGSTRKRCFHRAMVGAVVYKSRLMAA